MSKTETEKTKTKSKPKLKGKQAKIAKANAAKPQTEAESKPVEKCKNYGCCCTCVHFPKHSSTGEVCKCNVSKCYVAHKAKHPECYKCKF